MIMDPCGGSVYSSKQIFPDSKLMYLDFGNPLSLTRCMNSFALMVKCESRSNAAAGMGRFLLKGIYAALNAR